MSHIYLVVFAFKRTGRVKPANTSGCFDKPQLFKYFADHIDHRLFLDRSTLKSSAEKSNHLCSCMTTLKITWRDGERRGQRKKQKQERLKCKKTLLCCSQGSRIWRTGATEGYERTAVTLRVQFHSSNVALEARGRGAGR